MLDCLDDIIITLKLQIITHETNIVIPSDKRSQVTPAPLCPVCSIIEKVVAVITKENITGIKS